MRRIACIVAVVIAVLLVGAMPACAAQVDIGVASGGKPVRCLGQLAPCVRSSIDDDRLVIETGVLAMVSLERTYRAPGTHGMQPAGTLAVSTDASGHADLALTSRALVGAHPGSTCLRARLPATLDTAASTSAWRCIRYRPPITIGWAGDITLGSTYGSTPGDGRVAFRDVADLLRAPDLMIGNYEGTLSHGGSSRCSGGPLCFIFQGAPRYASGLRWAGFDVMSLANNHALDKGADARRQTVAAIRARGMDVTGLPEQITVRQVADTKVAIVGFGFTQGTMLIRDLANVRRVVARARRAGDVVVVVAHPGEEGAGHQHAPHGDEGGRGNTRAFMHAAIGAGADVVFASGPHVVRGIEQIDGRLAFYSTGNFVGWKNFGRGGALSNSGVADVTLDFDGTLARAGGTFHGVRLHGPGVPSIDTSGVVLRLVRDLSRADFGSNAPRIARDGTITLRG